MFGFTVNSAENVNIQRNINLANQLALNNRISLYEPAEMHKQKFNVFLMGTHARAGKESPITTCALGIEDVLRLIFDAYAEPLAKQTRCADPAVLVYLEDFPTLHSSPRSSELYQARLLQGFGIDEEEAASLGQPTPMPTNPRVESPALMLLEYPRLTRGIFAIETRMSDGRIIYRGSRDYLPTQRTANGEYWFNAPGNAMRIFTPGRAGTDEPDVVELRACGPLDKTMSSLPTMLYLYEFGYYGNERV